MENIVYLSFCQPNVDWPTLKKNVSAVMIRVGQGIWEDTHFREHYNNAVIHQVPFGLWHFHQPNMAAAPQVDFIKGILDSLKYKPVVFAIDEEEIDYYDANGVLQKLFPPSLDYNHTNLLQMCRDVRNMGRKVGIYTRKNYWEAWTKDTPEWRDYWLWIAAWYQYTGTVPPALPRPWTEYKIHQYTGGVSDVPGINGQACKEYFNGTHQQLIEFFAPPWGDTQPPEPPEEVNVASIHNVAIPIDKRAWMLKIETDQVIKNKDYGATWQDGFILPMGGMRIVVKPDGNKVLFLGAEETFEGRCKEIAGKGYPVGGEFTIDPGALLQVGWTPGAVDYPWAQNEIIKAIVDSLKDGAGNWLPVSIIVLRMMAVDAYPPTAIIGNDWQKRVFERVYDTFRYLMDNQGAPDVPIVLFCSDDKVEKLGLKTWLQYYDNGEFGQSIANRAGKLYLALSKKCLLSTDTFPDFGFYSFFTQSHDPVANYLPDGFDKRLLFYEFTSGAQKCKLVTDKNGVPTPISGALWCEPKAEMYKTLGVSTTEPPLPPPPPPPPPPEEEELTDAEQTARIIALENDMDTVIGILKELGERMGAL